MFTTDTISQIRHRDAEEQAAKVDSTPFALSNARNAARTAGNHELADMLDRRLAVEHPKRKDWYATQEGMSIRLQVIIRNHKTNTEAARIRNLRDTRQVSGSMAQEMYDELATKWIDDAETILDDARKLRSDATRELEQTILRVSQPHPGTVQDQILFESQATRAWNRLRSELDSMTEIKAADRLVAHLTEATSPQARKFLIEEGSVYLADRGLSKVDTIIRAALTKADPRVALADSEETAADHAASAVEYNARFTIDRVKHLPPTEREESIGDLERVFSDHMLIGEKTPLGRAAARAQKQADAEQAFTDAGLTIR